MKTPFKSTIPILICICSNLTLNLTFVSLVKSQPLPECSKLSPNDVIVTSQGAEPAGKYCDFQEKLPQVFTNAPTDPQLPSSPRGKFGNPYTDRGNVCRNRGGVDTICLTPSNASKLNELR